MVGCPQDPEWHPEGDVWVHTLMVMDQARAANGDLDRPRLTAVMLGALCHDLGKPVHHGDDRGPPAVAEPRAGRRRADAVAARPPERPFR